MPAFSGDALALFVGVDGQNIGMPFGARGVGVDMEFAKVTAEGLGAVVIQLLIAKENDLMIAKRGVELLNRAIAERAAQVDAGNFGAEMRREGGYVPSSRRSSVTPGCSCGGTNGRPRLRACSVAVSLVTLSVRSRYWIIDEREVKRKRLHDGGRGQRPSRPGRTRTAGLGARSRAAVRGRGSRRARSRSSAAGSKSVGPRTAWNGRAGWSARQLNPAQQQRSYTTRRDASPARRDSLPIPRVSSPLRCPHAFPKFEIRRLVSGSRKPCTVASVSAAIAASNPEPERPAESAAAR